MTKNSCVFFIIFFALFYGAVHGYKLNRNFLMVGGYRPSNIEKLAKYVVSLRIIRFDKNIFGAGHYCGGAILSKHVILTAAHCLINPDGRKIHPEHMIVVSGTPERTKNSSTTVGYRVERTIMHYLFRDFRHDIGIIKLKDPIEFDDHRAIAEISKTQAKQHNLCTTLGWGRIFENGPLANKIVYVNIFMFSQNSCKHLIKGFVWPGMLCGLNNNQDTCQGDSGGPLFCNNTLCGIVSFSHGGDRYLAPSAFTDLYHYQHWLRYNSTRGKHRPSAIIIGLMLAITCFYSLILIFKLF